ncbi:MAG TPA: PhoH family protein [Polyangiaceae bacterium]|nr:PhoH family protein [Polyangiaceae bacterium]
MQKSEAPVRARIEVESTQVLLALSGPQMQLLSEVARQSGAEVSLRGNTIHIAGEEASVRVAERFLNDAAELVGKGYAIGSDDVARSLRELRGDPSATLVELLDETITLSPRRRSVAPKTQAQRRYIETIRTRDLTFGIGPAGTGKTYLAMAMAVSAMLQKKVKRIILTRPAVEAGEKLGFLPGDLAEKVNPYLRPLYDALNDMLDFERIEQMRERGQIEVAPLAFMRGRTLNESFVILDEAQNATSEQMRMFLTRLGFSSKAVVTGDITQSDLPTGARSGLREARDLLSHIDGIGFCAFSDVDVVRHPLVQRIIVAYEKRDHELARQAQQRRDERLEREARAAVGRARMSPEPETDPGDELSSEEESNRAPFQREDRGSSSA